MGLIIHLISTSQKLLNELKGKTNERKNQRLEQPGTTGEYAG